MYNNTARRECLPLADTFGCTFLSFSKFRFAAAVKATSLRHALLKLPGLPAAIAPLKLLNS